MSSQRPGKGLSVLDNLDNPKAPSTSDWTGSRAFVFYPGHEETSYDYLTQLLPSPTDLPTKLIDSSETLAPKSSLPTAGEFMFGGGAMLGGTSEAALMDVIGVSDDECTDFAVETYLSGALPMYFGNHWGEEGTSSSDDSGKTEDVEWGKGRVKATWTGLVGLSADANPWVGRVPQSISTRKEPTQSHASNASKENKKSTLESEHRDLALSGEWVCAGYSGEGMVHAWLSGRALARMILGNKGDGKEDRRDPELPEPFLITEKRVRRTRIGNLTQIGNN